MVFLWVVAWTFNISYLWFQKNFIFQKKRNNLKMEGLCKHNQRGFCKFGYTCRKQHIKENCEYESCTSKLCNRRHPGICRFFTLYGACKFGKECAYKHIILKEHSDISELKSQIKSLASTISNMSQSIHHLEIQIKTLKS